MRRRIRGLWLVPNDLVAMLDPLGKVGHGLLGKIIRDANGPLKDAIMEIKKITTDDDPLQKIFNLLHKLPLSGSVDLNMPQWPAVRPAAYPGTEEIRGDHMADGPHERGRNFNDFVAEQEANP